VPCQEAQVIGLAGDVRLVVDVDKKLIPDYLRFRNQDGIGYHRLGFNADVVSDFIFNVPGTQVLSFRLPHNGLALEVKYHVRRFLEEAEAGKLLDAIAEYGPGKFVSHVKQYVGCSLRWKCPGIGWERPVGDINLAALLALGKWSRFSRPNRLVRRQRQLPGQRLPHCREYNEGACVGMDW